MPYSLPPSRSPLSVKSFEASYRHFINNRDKKSLENLVEEYLSKNLRAPTYRVKTPKGKRTVAFAFDIDGVLVRSKEPLRGATETLKLLQDNNIPFIFLTNGGGSTEKDHIALVGKRLSVSGLREDQFIQSHTPFRDLVPTLAEKNILVLGGIGNKIREVAHTYGFNHILIPSDIYRAYPDIYPFIEMTKGHHEEHGRNRIPLSTDGRLQISGILVWSSPRDWGFDLQLIMDLLLSEKGYLGTISTLNGDTSLPNNGYGQDSQPGLYWSNPDSVWATNHNLPRFAQGAFRAALQGIWAARTGGTQIVNETQFGKPTKATYMYGERALQNYYKQVNGEDAPFIDTVYMIGDNPASDIQGANNFRGKIEWRSILVESGIYAAGDEPEFIPDFTAAGVKEAVELALEEEGWRPEVEKVNKETN